jgi:transcriptional regulator with XRE-family HTH domain
VTSEDGTPLQDTTEDGDCMPLPKIASGENLRRLREEKGISLNELSRRAGVSAAHISQIERSLATPSLKTLEKIAQVLEMPTSRLLPSVSDDGLGQKVKRLRELAGLTQKQLGEKIGVSYSMVTQIETCRTKPSLKVLNSLGKVFGVTPAYFLMDCLDEELSIDHYGNGSLRVALNRPEVRQVIDLIAAWTGSELASLAGIIQRLNTYRSPLDAQYQEVKEFLDHSTNEERQLVLNLIDLLRQSGTEGEENL